MAPKRTAEGNAGYQNSKRHKTAKVDTTNGQRGVFGDLKSETTAPTGDSDLDCEDDSAALAYLKSVRTQASTIPHVLVAQKAGPTLPPDASDTQAVDRSIYITGVGDFRGYYQDGAYTAYPEGPFDENAEDCDEDYEDEDRSDATMSGPSNSTVDEIRTAYFTSITQSYLALRSRLQISPPQSALLSLPSTHPTTFPKPKEYPTASADWSSRLRSTDPKPAQLAAMHKDCVLRLLHIVLNNKFLRKGHELRERTSRWIWGLLARLPEQGELDYAEIGCVRELGKRAVLMMVSLAEHDALKEVAGASSDSDGYDYEDGEGYDEGGDDGEGEYYEQEYYDENTTVKREPVSSKNGDPDKVDPAQEKTEAAAPSQAQRPTSSSDVEMDLDTDREDGEVADTPAPLSPPRSDPAADTESIELAKARLLAQLEGDSAGDAKEPELDRREANERATLNMILTVAGEFYGQRDLLEFRDPFGG
ncbi:hypothetical protein GGR57DRAFT_473652 [Xylariaceae sp. FL1272]|nr:hypothetical protein GGR57DRAFT_473652 [Xylariaceae sp. FL1272]